MLVLRVGGEAVGQAETAAFRIESKNRLKQLGLSGHNYMDQQTFLPLNGVDSVRKTANHSWTTRLLPFLEPATASSIKMDQPWDHVGNSQAMSREVPAMLNKAIKTNSVGAYGAAHYAGNVHVFPLNKTHGMRDTTDGSSNTLWIGEVNGGFRAWGDPANVRDPATGIGGGASSFGGPWDGKGTQFLLLDGSVRLVNSNVPSTTLKALATPAGGEIIEDF